MPSFDIKEGHCFCWNELSGRRGNNEVGISATMIQSLPPEIVGFIIFGHMLGQNINKSLAVVMLYAVSNSHVRVPKQKFLEYS